MLRASIVTMIVIATIAAIFGGILAENMIYQSCGEDKAYELWNEKVILCEAIR